MGLANALDDFLSPMQMVIIRGEQAQADEWAAHLCARYAPHRLIFAIPRDAAELPPALADKRAAAQTLAYVCTGMTCTAPLADLQEVAHSLARNFPQKRAPRK